MAIPSGNQERKQDEMGRSPIDSPLTDFTNADRFVAEHGDSLRYDHQSDRWCLWTGTHWCPDPDEEVFRRARASIRSMLVDATSQGDERAIKHAVASQSLFRLKAVEQLARHDAAVRLQAPAADHIWWLNVANGTLDLKTGELRAARREDGLTYCLPVGYDPEAQAPGWLMLLRRAFCDDEDLISYFQRAVGYALTGSTEEQVFFLLLGEGENGKSTVLEVLSALLGALAQQASFETFLTRRSQTIPADIARMQGVRFVTAGEPDSDRALNCPLLKLLTGGDRITARYLYGSHFEYVPEFKLFLAVNRVPAIRDAGHAMRRRLRVIPFDAKITEEERNRTLKDELIGQELSGILTWAVEGCKQWLADGLGTCQAVEDATARCWTTANPLAEFFEHRCEFRPDLSVPSRQLRLAVMTWMEERGYDLPSEKSIAQALRLRPERLENRKRNGLKWWFGVGLKS